MSGQVHPLTRCAKRSCWLHEEHRVNNRSVPASWSGEGVFTVTKLRYRHSWHPLGTVSQTIGSMLASGTKYYNFALLLSPSVLQGTCCRTSQHRCKSQGRGCKTQADGCCLWMASLCDSNCITLNYGWNDPFPGWGYKSDSLKLPTLSIPFSFFLSVLYFLLYDLHMKKQHSPILAPLTKTNVDSDESANYYGRLFPAARMEVDGGGRRMYFTLCVLRFKAQRGWAWVSYPSWPTAVPQRLNAHSRVSPSWGKQLPLIQHRRLKNEQASDGAGVFNERPMPGMYGQDYLVKLGDLFF